MRFHNMWIGLLALSFMLIRSCGYEDTYPADTAVKKGTYSSIKAVGPASGNQTYVETEQGQVHRVYGIFPSGKTWKSVRIKDGKLSGLEQR